MDIRIYKSGFEMFVASAATTAGYEAWTRLAAKAGLTLAELVEKWIEHECRRSRKETR